ncbi:MAG: N-6 DNA methylase [bacterium]|nr:N-6 DNA methylase [bacterium]
MANEAKTIDLTGKLLAGHGYSDSGVTIERELSDSPKIKKLLANASKKGAGFGKPDFIIRSENYPELLLVIECKAENKFHESATGDQYADYAADGAKLYASFLAKEYDVIAIAISGQDEKEFRISHFLNLKGQDKAYPMDWQGIMALGGYHTAYMKTDLKFNQDYDALLVYSKKLNDKLHSKKIKESQRSLLISAVLISLGNKAFRLAYKAYDKASEIAAQLYNTVKLELDRSEIPKEKVKNILHAYSFIQVNASLTGNKEFVLELIDEIDENINGFIKTHAYFDAIGQFYIEFLRYANADKGLGIVLTPPHITKLFVKLAEIDKDSVVLDNCCGTGGFLISAMHRMVQDTKGDQAKEAAIKEKQLVGIEWQDDIYALAASNMILHEDGKSNILQGDCFKLVDEVKNRFKPTAALLNPPYKSQSSDPEELEFALNALEMIEKGGKCVIILPMSCALAQSGVRLEKKRKLLDQHTLEAVLSMPDELFHNSKVGVVTCVMVFTANKPHPKDKKTWFGYWKDDGFTKIKNKGRIDQLNKWDEIEKTWLSAYQNRDDVPGHSVKQVITHEDEWCAEAYMETAYEDLNQESFAAEVRKYIAFKVMNHLRFEFGTLPITSPKRSSPAPPINLEAWRWFELQEIFDLKKGKRLTKEAMQLGETPFIGAIDSNNGYREWIADLPNHQSCTLTVNYNGSVAEAFYQPEPFWASDDVNVLYPKFAMTPAIGLFICAIIRMEKYRFNYGRKWHLERMKESRIKLPVDPDGNPDWDYMQNYVESQPFSSQI